MYESFYGFTERPFSKTPDPRFFYLSRIYREALEGFGMEVQRIRPEILDVVMAEFELA
jgi:hypothetical protein